MKDIVLIGGGGHCEAIIDVIEQEKKFSILGIIDKPELLGNNILGYQIIGSDIELKKIRKVCDNALITVGQIKSPTPRIELYEKLKSLEFNLPTVISPRAYFSKHSNIGTGSIVMHDAIVNANVTIGDNCIINTKSLIEHGSIIGNHCHISTNAVINGDVTLDDGSFIGSGVITKEGIRIDSNFFAKAGSIIK